MDLNNQSFKSLTNVISTKAVMKQEVYRNTKKVFNELVHVVSETIADLKKSLPNIDDSIPINYRLRNEFEIEIVLAGDVIIFHMHTNVFQFDKEHTLWKGHYLQEDDFRSYCGIIYVYNFLKDSFIYDRKDDIGYLIARIFINKELHYMVDGKRQMGFLYNNFENSIISKEELRKILESILLYSLDFDLFIPRYDDLKEITLHQMEEISRNLPLRTGKRLGFKFQADSDDING